jgi:hypothetical protein
MLLLPHIVLQLLTRTSHSVKSSYSKTGVNWNSAHNQHGEASLQAHSSAIVKTQTIFDGQENPASDSRDLADDNAAATCSHLETPEYDITSQTQAHAYAYNRMDETYTYELGRWAYETSHENLTLAERLEKGKWEAERLERL